MSNDKTDRREFGQKVETNQAADNRDKHREEDAERYEKFKKDKEKQQED